MGGSPAQCKDNACLWLLLLTLSALILAALFIVMFSASGSTVMEYQVHYSDKLTFKY